MLISGDDDAAGDSDDGKNWFSILAYDESATSMNKIYVEGPISLIALAGAPQAAPARPNPP